MSGAPAVGPAADRLPPPSTTRFILLILMVCAATSFAAYWWLVAERGDWIAEQSACLPRLGAGLAGAGVSGFNDCIAGVALRQEGVVLLGPLTVIVTCLLIAVASVPVLLWIWGSGTPSARLVQWFESCLGQVGSRRRPGLVAVKRGSRGQARVFGIFPRYWVLADPLLAAGSDGQLGAVLRHELAHLHAGDVDRARLARTIWGVFFVLVAPALTFSVAEQGGSAWTDIGLRLLVLLILIHLTYQSLLRAREHEADLLADVAQPRSRSEPRASTLVMVLAAQPEQHSYRSFLPAFLLAHPSHARRAAVLDQPRLAARLMVLEFLSVGIGAGVIFQELAFAVGALLPRAAEAAYWITGAAVAVPVCLVAVNALWRHEQAGPGPLKRPTVLLAGGLLGTGLVAGSQLSPRAATNWENVQLTVSPVLPGNLSLSAVGLRGAATLASIAVAGSAIFALWALAFARELTAAAPQGSRRHQRRLSVCLAIAVLAVPMGTWFMVCRLAGDSVDGPTGTLIANLLQGRVLLLALALTLAAAVVPLAAAAAIHRHRRTGPRRYRVTLTAGVWCLTGAIVLVAPWSAGAALRRSVTPGPPIGRSGPGALPLLPPDVTAGTGPIGAGIMCWALSHLPPQDIASPVVRRQFGALLQRTPDQALDAIGGVLIRTADAPLATARAVVPAAWLAAGFRCNLLLSAPSASP